MSIDPTNHFDKLPSELLPLIFCDAQTGLASLSNGRTVCKKWKASIDSPASWFVLKATYLAEFGELPESYHDTKEYNTQQYWTNAFKRQCFIKKNLHSQKCNSINIKYSPDSRPTSIQVVHQKVYMLANSKLSMIDLSSGPHIKATQETILDTGIKGDRIYPVNNKERFFIKDDGSFTFWDTKTNCMLFNANDLKHELAVAWENLVVYNSTENKMKFFEVNNSALDVKNSDKMPVATAPGIGDKPVTKSRVIGHRLFITCNDGSFHVYDLKKRIKLELPGLIPSKQTIENFRANKKYFVIWKKGTSEAEVHDLETGNLLRTVALQALKQKYPIEIHGNKLIGIPKPGAANDGSNTVIAWDLSTGQRDTIYQSDHDLIDIRLKNNDLLGISQNHINIWDATTAEHISTISVPETTPQQGAYPAFARVQNRIVAIHHWARGSKPRTIDNYLGFWDLLTGAHIKSVKIPSSSRTSSFTDGVILAQTPDDNRTVISDFSCEMPNLSSSLTI